MYVHALSNKQMPPLQIEEKRTQKNQPNSWAKDSAVGRWLYKNQEKVQFKPIPGNKQSFLCGNGHITS